MVFCLIISLVQVRAGKLNAGDVVLENSKSAWPDRILPGLLYFFFFCPPLVESTLLQMYLGTHSVCIERGPISVKLHYFVTTFPMQIRG